MNGRKNYFPFHFRINHSEALSYRISFPLDSCPFMVTPVPPGMLSQSPGAILIALISRGGRKRENLSHQPRGPFLSLLLLSLSHYIVGKTPRIWLYLCHTSRPLFEDPLSSWTCTTTKIWQPVSRCNPCPLKKFPWAT